MTKGEHESLNKSPEKGDLHRVAGNVKQKPVFSMSKKISNPDLLKIMSEDNPLFDVIFDMLQWGGDGVYLTPQNARHLREAFTLLSALEAGKPFEDRIIGE